MLFLSPPAIFGVGWDHSLEINSLEIIILKAENKKKRWTELNWKPNKN